MISKEGEDIFKAQPCSLSMCICSCRHLKNGTLLSGQSLTHWLVLSFPMLPEMNWEAFQSVGSSCIKTFKHLMVVGVGEDQALNSLHKFRLIVLEELCNDSATSGVSHYRERSSSALILGQEILPYVLAMLISIAAVGNSLLWDAIVSHIWVQDNYRLTHCLSIFNVGKYAAHVQTFVDKIGSSPRSSDRGGRTLDQHEAAALVFVKVWANEYVALRSVRLAIITNPHFLHSILRFHYLLNVAHCQIANLFKRFLTHSADWLTVQSHKTTTVLLYDAKSSLGELCFVINWSNYLMELRNKRIAGSWCCSGSSWLHTTGSVLTTSSGSSSSSILSYW